MKKLCSLLLSAITVFGVFGCFSGCKEENNGDTPPQKAPYVAKQLSNEADFEKVFYVAEVGKDDNAGTWDAPFATIAKAQEEVRKINGDMQKDIAVVVRGGYYSQASTLSFNESDNGTNGHEVVYMGFPEEEARVSGGVVLSDWKKSGDLYYTSLKANYVRNFFVNGNRATLARTPNGIDYTTLVKWDEENKKAVGKLSDMMGAQQFEAVFYMEWSESIARVESVTQSGEEGIMNFASREADIFFRRKYTQPAQVRNDMYVYYQNAMEFLDQPGEFYYDKEAERLYYYPREGENMSWAETIVPNLEKVIDIKGTGEAYVENLRFENLVVEHNADSTVATQGYAEIQSGHYVKDLMPDRNWLAEILGAAVMLEQAKNITITDCNVRHTGAGGIQCRTKVQDCAISGNVLTDIAAYAVIISPDIAYRTGQSMFNANLALRCHDISIDNNYVHWAGIEYRRSAAIVNTFGYNISITNNEVAYVGYTGISCGWGWSVNDYGITNCVIARNNIHHYGLYGSDLGGIYTLNNQPGLLVEENYIHENANTGMATSGLNACAEGIYLDEGTNNAIVRSNQIAYAGENRRLICYHVAGENIVEEGNKGVLCGDTLDEEIVKAAGPTAEWKRNQPYADVTENTLMVATRGGQQTCEESGLYGYKIECNEDISVKGLGRFYIQGNNGKHTLSIYSDDKKQMASCEVDMSVGQADAYGYKYAKFDKPVQLKKGERYFIVSEEKKDGDWYLFSNSYVYLNEKVQVLGIARGDKLTYVKNLNYGFVGINIVV